MSRVYVRERQWKWISHVWIVHPNVWRHRKSIRRYLPPTKYYYQCVWQLYMSWIYHYRCTYTYYHNWPNSKRNHPFPWQFLLAFVHTYLSEIICNYGQNLQRISLRILMLSAFLTTILNEKLKVILLQLFLFGIPVGKADGILQEFRSKSFRKLDGLS